MRCRFCGSNKELHIDSTSHQNNRVYKYYACRSCTTTRFKRYRKTTKGKLATKRANIKYAQSHPERVRAWNQVQYKLKESDKELQPCIKCGSLQTHRHHPNPNKPLEFIFLCPLHHKLEDMLYLNKSNVEKYS